MSRVLLVPFDPESEQHAKRLYQQRVDCGWGSDKIQEWRIAQKEGTKVIFWVMLPDSHNHEARASSYSYKETLLETLLLDDTGTLGCIPEDRPFLSTKKFFPIGHISLDLEIDDLELACKSNHLCAVTTFYISQEIQGGGLGTSAMKALEHIAMKYPISATTLALKTLSNKMERKEELYAYVGVPMPASTEDWYKKRGYVVVKTEDEPFHKIDDQKSWSMKWVYMRKSLTG